MYYNDAIMDIAREFPHVDTFQLRAMLDDEVSQCRARGYARQVEESAALIRLWLKEAEVNTDMVRFVASHRRAYVWAALVREQMKPPEDGTKGDTSPATEAYREAARRLHQHEGECEVDDGAVVSFGDDPGAYVQAWVWVSAQDAGVCCGCGSVSDSLSEFGQCPECDPGE